MEGTIRYCAAVTIDKSGPPEDGWPTEVDSRKCRDCEIRNACGMYQHLEDFHRGLREENRNP